MCQVLVHNIVHHSDNDELWFLVTGWCKWPWKTPTIWCNRNKRARFLGQYSLRAWSMGMANGKVYIMLIMFISVLEPRMRGQLSAGLSAARRKLKHGWAATDSRWTQRRHKWYGLDRDSSWPKLTLWSSSCCLPTFIFQPRCPTLEFILTVSWPCGITWQQLVVHVFSSWGSCGPSEALWRLMQPRRWHRRSCEIGLTTATVYYMVSAKTSCDVCRVYRMRRQDSSLVQENTITSLLCCVIFIGYLCDKG